ncbi:MAG: UDP-2,3-diacylglucosamine diphosphatase [Metallibacterium sp.]
MHRLQRRSVFISDVHLGLPDCKAAYLLDFLQRLDCAHLYLVGDIIDLQALARRPWWHPSHGAVLHAILALAARGTRITYIPGNHDAPLRALAGQTIAGIAIALDAVHVAADGRRYHVSHGDEHDPEQIGRAWQRFGDFIQNFLCGVNRRFNRLRHWLKLPYLPLSLVLKSCAPQALAYIRAFETRVARTTQAAGFDGAICGHIHYGHVRRIEGVLYLNDGDWVEHCTALTEDAHGRFELLHWSERPATLGAAGCGADAPSPARLRALRPLAHAALHAK